jgi:hypothetical protein
MTQVGRCFGLSDILGSGIFCGENGVFVADVALLEQSHGPDGAKQWLPRPVNDLNRDLSKRYGIPVEINAKIASLKSIARALGRGDLFHAQIATLHLQIPDPPVLTKSIQNTSEVIHLAQRLRSSSLLKADWDPAKHPRWPAGSPGSIGGEFAPAGSTTVDSSTAGSSTAPLMPVQLTIPAPFEVPGAIPFPSEIVPAPVIPNIYPRDVPRNPYPDRPECEEEWAEAARYCNELLRSGRLGKGDYSGMGKSFYQCVMGQVSEACGGNPTSA